MIAIRWLVAATLIAVLADADAAPPETAAGAIPVELVERDGRYRLLRGGEPYEIRGAGIGGGDVAAFAALAAHGGTSFRTWSTDDAQDVLDEALRHDLTVILCINIGRERHGFDYNDEEAVARQLEFARGEVLKYRDHPALLAWMIGNEPNLFFENPRVFDAIGEISDMIHDVDGKHPSTTALAGFSPELADLIGERAPSLDFVSIQFYGAIVQLPEILADMDYDEPLLVTEWGTVGHWEMPETAWDAPVELDSSEKADFYLESHEAAIASSPGQIFGSYVFLWGQKQERTPTWYGMFLADGSETETIDVMHYIWNGEWPENRAPRIDGATLDGRTAFDSVTLDAGSEAEARVVASDPEGQPLRYRWELMRESTATQSGGDREDVPPIVEGRIADAGAPATRVRVPAEGGAYRLFVYVYDNAGKAGHANIPFYVE